MSRLRRSAAVLLAALTTCTSLWAAAPPAEIRRADLPREAQQTLALIDRGGPFPYPRDGVVFGNYEHRLPAQRRGHYREYTVPTPGARNRGARRIIAGGQPPSAFFYTPDHYQTFRKIQP